MDEKGLNIFKDTRTPLLRYSIPTLKVTLSGSIKDNASVVCEWNKGGVLTREQRSPSCPRSTFQHQPIVAATRDVQEEKKVVPDGGVSPCQPNPHPPFSRFLAEREPAATRFQ
ncbi:hypothetical protein AB1N83_006358 [Pleurotus pulmonarius]